MEPVSNIYNIDCMEYMKSIPDKFFELAIVDPPYGIGMHKKTTIGKRGKTYSTTNYKKGNWDSSIPTKEYFDELFRISNNQIIWGANYFLQYLNNTPCVLFWSKQYIPAGFTMADCEMAWSSFKTSSKMVRVKIEHNNVSNNKEIALNNAKIHQTQKPIGLYKFLLNNYAKEGDKIFDSHLGSGSSRIAAYNLGFDFYGCEIDTSYFEASIKRFNNFKSQLELQFN